jgi:uncharacterized membrane protein YphA (DoxX/SURF4 family)
MVGMGKIKTLKSFYLLLSRFLLGGTFVYAAIAKIADPPGFVADIIHYRLTAYSIAVATGVYLPWLELICGTCLVCRWRERAALVIISGLCLLFTLALSSAWWRGLDLNCGCFGHGPSASPVIAIIRSVSLGTISIWLLSSSNTGISPQP